MCSLLSTLSAPKKCWSSNPKSPSPSEKFDEIVQFYKKIEQTANNSLGKLVLELGINRCNSDRKKITEQKLKKKWNDLAPLIHDCINNDDAFKGEIPLFLRKLNATVTRPAQPLTSQKVIDLFNRVGLVHSGLRNHHQDPVTCHNTAYIQPDYNEITGNYEDIKIVVIHAPAEQNSSWQTTSTSISLTKTTIEQFNSPTKLYEAIFNKGLASIEAAKKFPTLKPYDWDANSPYSSV